MFDKKGDTTTPIYSDSRTAISWIRKGGHRSTLARTTKNGKIFELLALINEELWVGHFSYWTEQNMPVFKHSLFLNNKDEYFEDKISQTIDIAIKECERMYPIFKVVLTKGMEPKQALYPMMMHTIGQA